MKMIKQLLITYLILNLISMLLIGQFTLLALITNLLPTMMMYFLFAMRNEKKIVDKKKKSSIMA